MLKRGAVLLALGLVGCSGDLFHDTSWEAFCEKTPSAEPCQQVDSGTDADGQDGARDAGRVTIDAASTD